LKAAQSTWDGSSLLGKTILIRSEHIIAEQIMFATCLPDIVRDAAKCVVVCPAILEQLFRRSFPQATVFGVPPGSDNAWRLTPQVKIDVQCAAGSLPRLLRRSAEAFSKQPQLLIADPAKVAHWRERIAAFGAGMKIGIAWRSDFDSAIQPSRVPPLADWQPVLTAPGIRWISLQQRQDSEEIERTCADHNTKIHDWSDTSSRSDLDSIAAKIAALDLVITADNTIAHLAGALGVPTWVVLAQPPAWHWLSDREQSLWYESVRLFRPDGLDKPRDLFRQLREELLKTTFRLDEESKIGPPHASWSQVRARIQQ
jgi:hypothetical protein